MTAKPGAGTEGLAAAGSTEGRATGWAKVRRWLMPGAAEADPGFRAEIDRLSVRALWIVAGVMAAMPLLGALFHGIVQWVEPRENPAPWLIPLNLTVAALLAALSRWDRVRRYARPVALAAIWHNNVF